MATRRWCGRAGAVPQVTTLTPGTVSVGSTFTVEINERAVTVTAATTVVADVTALLVAALTAAAYPEFEEVTWTDSTTHVTATGPDDGTPFTLTLTAGGTGSPTFGDATTTSPSGPNWWDAAANWRENSVPVSSDDVTIDEGPDILFGLDQSAVDLASLSITDNFTGEIGRPRSTNLADPDAGYPEYRDQRLKIGATVVTISSPSRRLRLDLDTTQTAVTVNDTGAAASAGEHALDLVGAHASNVLRVNRGDVGVAPYAGDTATFPTITVAFRTQRDGDADVTLGAGLTVTSVEQSGGAVELNCAVTTYTKEGGSLERFGTGTVGTLYNRVGECRDAGTGTITTLHQAGTYVRQGLAPLTVTTATVYGGSVTRDPLGKVTWTNPVNLSECSLSGGPDDAQPAAAVAYFDVGRHRKLAISDI